MKCWKCGKDLTDGTGSCVYCEADQKRSLPVTQVGKALRSLYDRYGAKTVLTNGAYLVSGLGDLVGEEKKLRNQLKMAMDAGIGRVYLEQLEKGTPDADFDRRVKLLLADDAGLNDKVAGELTGYFDEMIGWRAGTARRAASSKRKASGGADMDRRAKEAAAKNRREESGHQASGNKEVDRTGRYADHDAPEPEIDRRKKRAAPKTEEFVSPEPLPDQPVPGPEPSGCMSAILTIIVFAGSVALTVYVSPIFSVIMIFVFFYAIAKILTVKWTSSGTKNALRLSRNGDQVICSWPENKNVATWLLAVDDKWVGAGVVSPVQLPKVAAGSKITLASIGVGSNSIVYCDSKTI